MDAPKTEQPIAIIEDDESILESYRRLVKEQGIIAIFFERVPPIQELLLARGIITDGIIAGKNGGKVAYELRQAGYTGKIYCVTGACEYMERHLLLPDGSPCLDGIVEKPFTSEQFIEIVDSIRNA